MSEGGENLTFRDAFASDPPARYASAGNDDDEGEFESDSDEDTPHQQQQPAAAVAALRSASTGGAAPTRGSALATQSAIDKALESGLWKKQLDTNSGKHYYYNVLTRETTWDLAKTLGAAETTPASAKSAGMGFDANASLGSIDDIRRSGKHPASLQLDNSFAAGSDVGLPLQLPASVLEATGPGGSLPVRRETAAGGGQSRGGASAGEDKDRKPSVKSVGSDDFEDDDTARAKIVARGGRVPIVSSFRTAGMDLYNEVSAFKAFASGSDGESAVSSAGQAALPAAALTEDAMAPAAKAGGTKDEADTAPPVNRRRAIFESDSSDFSTASQTIQKNRTTAVVVGPSVLEATARPVPELTAVPALSSSAQPATATTNAAAQLPPQAASTSATTSWKPFSEQPYVPPLPGHVLASSAASRAAETPTVDPALASRSRDATVSPVFAAPGGYAATTMGPGMAPQIVMMQGAYPQASAVKEHGEALDHLVRAYTQLRGAPPQQSASSRRDPDAKLADLIERALAKANAEDEERESLLDDENDALGTDPRQPRSSRTRVAHLVQHHQDATRYARWGAATTSVLQPSSSSYSRRRAAAQPLAAGASADDPKVDDCILNVVLSLFMERAVGGATEVVPHHSRRRPAPSSSHADPLLATAEPSQPSPTVVVPVGASWAGGGASSAHHVDMSIAPEAFRDENGLREAIDAAFDKYVIALLRRSRRDWGPENTQAMCRLARVALLDLSLALQQVVATAVSVTSRTNPAKALPPSFAVLRVDLMPQGSPGGDEMQSRLVYNILNCLPVELLVDDGAAAAQQRLEGGSSTGLGKGSSKFRFEYWVTIAHCNEMLLAVTALTRRLEVFSQDSYAAFDSIPAQRAADATTLVTPEKPIVVAVLNNATTQDAKDEASDDRPSRRSGADDDAAAASLVRLYQDLDAAEHILFSVSKLVDEVVADVAKDSPMPKHSSSLSRAQRHRVEAEIALANTLDDFLAEEGIRGAVKRRAAAVVRKVMDTNPNAALLEHTQNKVNRMVERLKYELDLA